MPSPNETTYLHIEKVNIEGFPVKTLASQRGTMKGFPVWHLLNLLNCQGGEYAVDGEKKSRVYAVD